MANVATQILFDKDIKNLQSKEQRYFKVVGNPKELVIFVSPKGTKSFSLKLRDDNGKVKFIGLKEFRAGIYSVAEARKEATKILGELEKGKDIEVIKGNGGKYIYKNLFNLYIEQKQRQGLNSDYIKRVIQTHNNYIMPNLADKDAKNIKYSDLLALLKPIFNPSNPSESRLETIHRLINHLKCIFDIAIKDRYIDFNPTFGLNTEFPTKHKFNKQNSIDSRLPALTDTNLIKEFIIDLKMDNRLNLETKRALWLQVLTINRPINTASAKWKDIDLEGKKWRIPASEMKMGFPHEVALNTYAIKILEQQKLFISDISGFVFPRFNKEGHIHRDTLSKAVRNLGSKGKYKRVATPHGFRATFRTICSIYEAELLKLYIGNKVVESVLAHKTNNDIEYAYEREKSTFEQKLKLMQWYGDYLNSIENLGIL